MATSRPPVTALYLSLALAFFALPVWLVGCSQLDPDTYAEVLLEQLEAVEAGGDPLEVLEARGFDPEEFFFYEMRIYTDPARAEEVARSLELNRREAGGADRPATQRETSADAGDDRE